MTPEHPVATFFVRASLPVLLVLTSAGCGDAPQVAPLSGKVTYKGQPLEFGSVMLQPLAGGQPSHAAIQPDGTFEMEIRGVGSGAAVGKNRIRVTCFPAQRPGSSANDNRELALGRSLIPPKYNSFKSSGLEIDVQPRDNESLLIQLDDR